MTFEQKWLEFDFNPFILFDANGKVINLNSEAQFLLGIVTAKEIFELTTANASINFGFKTTFIDLSYGRFKFFALTVGYENENEIGIKLYRFIEQQIVVKKPQGELTNIFSIIDLCIMTNSINSNTNFIKDYDPAIPDVMIDIDLVVKIINKIYLCFADNMQIKTKVFYRVGEYIKLQEQKYGIFSIEISSQNKNKNILQDLEKLCHKNNIIFHTDKNSISIDLPIITK